MSWGLGNKRWTVPFMSKNGTACRVDIYKRGYSGSEVITIANGVSGAPGVAATDPFYWEEDDDQDLLIPVRYKTGYLNLIETTTDGLLDLYPTTNTEHYVEFLYYTSSAYPVIMFAGFIQAQSFENEWAPCPREVSLPVISPLGLMDGYKFAYKNPCQWVTLKDLVQEVMQNSDEVYDNVVFPCVSENFHETGEEFKSLNLMSIVVSPYSEDYDGTNDVSKLYDPSDFGTFIEGICNCFGLTAHDDGRTLVFSKFDHSGDYFRMYKTGSSFTKLDNLGGSVVNLSNMVDVRGTDNTISSVLPLRKLTISYDGEVVKTASINTDRFVKTPTSIGLTDWRLVRLTALDDEITYDYPVPNGTIITAEGKLSAQGVIFGAVGEGSLTEQIMMFVDTSDTPFPSSTNIFEWKIYNWCNRGCRLKFNISYGPSVNNLNNEQPWGASAPEFRIYVRCGSKYWYGSDNSWNDSTSYPKTVTGAGDHEVIISSPGVNAPLVIEVFPYNNFYMNMMYVIKDVQLDANASAVAKYMDYTDKNPDRVVDGTPSPEDGEISMLFSDDAITDHRLVTTPGAGADPVWLTYNYLKQTQRRLIFDCEMKSGQSLPGYYACRKYQFWKSAWRWRLLGVTFHPWDNLFTMTLQSSPTQDV